MKALLSILNINFLTMKTTFLIIYSFFLLHVACTQAVEDLSKPITSESVVFEEKDGFVMVEAEHFYKQSLSDIRKWYITSEGKIPDILPDPDTAHYENASNGAYIEILPDTRVTHGDTLIRGVNFINTAGEMAVVHYKVKINQPGRYYVWVRAYSSGSEDNGLHVGMNGSWPESGQRMQWCVGKNTWRWDSKQRTSDQHCGVPYQIYLDIESPGIYDIQFSMREDGFEMDQFLLTLNRDFIPDNPATAEGSN
jgi:hypothetical protein